MCRAPCLVAWQRGLSACDKQPRTPDGNKQGMDEVMRIAYLDCFAGISGDMFLGALVDAGVPLQVLRDAVDALELDATLELETVDRSGISSAKVHVLEHGKLADGGPGDSHAHEAAHTPTEEHGHTHPHEHPEDPGHTHEAVHTHEHPHTHPHTHSHEPEHPHTHTHSHEAESKHGHAHEHVPGKPHVHGRSLREIRALIQAAPLSEVVKVRAVRTFELLGHAEAKIHNVPVEEIHFHEVGAVDAIVDIVAASAGIEHLNSEGAVAWHASPVNVGGGMVVCAHGTFPVPAPATADLLREVPTYSAHVQKELVTPTGAALLRALAPKFGPQPAMKVQQIGYGAGSRNPKDFPNVLRLSIGESFTGLEGSAPPAPAPRHAAPAPAAHSHGNAPNEHRHEEESVTVLETALDDISPQVLAHVAERGFAMGALDVMLTPVIMKKGRPGTLVTVLCNAGDAAALQDLLLRETSTLGVRMHREHRSCLERSHVSVETQFGKVRMKLGTRGDEELNAAPEFEDCRAAAEKHGVAVKTVMQAAIAAYALEKAK